MSSRVPVLKMEREEDDVDAINCLIGAVVQLEPRRYRLSAAPLLRELDSRGGLEEAMRARRIQVFIEYPTRTCEFWRFCRFFRRARARGWVNFWTADAVITELFDTHPSLIYGDAYWNPITEIEAAAA